MMSVKEYALELNIKAEDVIKKAFNPNKRISHGIKRQFNIGYLFLEKLYYQLNINKICEKDGVKRSFSF